MFPIAVISGFLICLIQRDSALQVSEIFLGEFLLAGVKYFILLYFILRRQDACFTICIFRIGQEMVFSSSPEKNYKKKKKKTFEKIILFCKVG